MNSGRKYASLDGSSWQLELGRPAAGWAPGLGVGLSLPQLSLINSEEIYLLIWVWYQPGAEKPLELLT